MAGNTIPGSNARGVRKLLLAMVVVVGALIVQSLCLVSAGQPTSGTLKQAFDHLSKNGNSNCSAAFMDSIPNLPKESRLQGSCCSPMSFHRYSEQVAALRKYVNIADIPPDPYDIPADLAARLLASYEAPLNAEQQKAYDYAMKNSHEKGPCCCQCWRWHVYGGLAKTLIRDRGFTGTQIAEVWDFSDGCGGDEDHIH